MAIGNEKILTAEREMELRKPIDDYVGGIQEKINALRVDGTDKVVSLQNKIDSLNVTKAGARKRTARRLQNFRENLQKQKRLKAKIKKKSPS